MPVPQVEINKREKKGKENGRRRRPQKIWEIFFLSLQLDLILSGYVKNASEDVQLVKKLFHILPTLPESQAPGSREWKIVLSLLDKALKVRTRTLRLILLILAEICISLPKAVISLEHNAIWRRRMKNQSFLMTLFYTFQNLFETWKNFEGLF